MSYPLHRWILSKFTTPTIYRGSVYVAAMSDELLVFGVDKDGDAIPDGIDNCPTVANADRRNTNEDAERAGNQPLVGDACDPNSSTALAITSTVYDNSLSGTCNNILLSPNGTKIQGFSSILPMLSGLSLTGYIGNDAGAAPQANGTTGPAFCPCPGATADEVTRQKCLVAASFGGGGCLAARDDAFPPLDGGAPPLSPVTSWKTITQSIGGSPQRFAAQNVVHNQPKVSAVSAKPGWGFYQDLASFGLDASAGGVDDNWRVRDHLEHRTWWPKAGQPAWVLDSDPNYCFCNGEPNRPPLFPTNVSQDGSPQPVVAVDPFGSDFWVSYTLNSPGGMKATALHGQIVCAAGGGGSGEPALTKIGMRCTSSVLDVACG